MSKLEHYLTIKRNAEKREILLEDLKDFEKELALWQSWLVLNAGAFTPAQVSECLRRAKEIVNELLLANVE